MPTTVFSLKVAVGMPVARHPPHSSRRAALPHRAPASGRRAGTRRCLPYAAERLGQETPARGPAPGFLRHVPLGPLPALHLLRRSRGATCVRRLPRDSAAVRLPAPGTSRSCPVGAPCGPGERSSGQRQGLPGAAHRVATPARGRRPRRVRRRLARTASTVGPAACAERVGTRAKRRLRGSILGLRVPLSPLRRHRGRCLRLTRGQGGWLDLHCLGRAPCTTVPACPGADPNAPAELRPTGENAGNNPQSLRCGPSAPVGCSSKPLTRQ
jgi:hypothetical protein